jgi:uncharacterized membrane protein
MGQRVWISGLVLLIALAAIGEPALACSVCVSASEQTREAYYLTTLLMMTIPFALLAGIVFWLRRRLGGSSER